MGIGGLVLIASLTDHCCHLLVKTKYHAIKHVIEIYKSKENVKPSKRKKYSESKMNSTVYSSLSESDLTDDDFNKHDDDEVIIDMDEVSLMEHHMIKHMSYGDVGQVCFGKPGLYVVNACIAMTQFCFCVAYFIFIGNTIQALFPYEECRSAIQGVDNISMPLNSTPECKIMYLDIQPVVDNQKRLHILHRHGRSVAFSSNISSLAVDFPNLDIANGDNLINNASSLAVNVPYLDVAADENSTNITTVVAPTTTEFSSSATTSSEFSPSLSPSTESFSSTVSPELQNETEPHGLVGFVLQTTSPNLIYLVASPLPIFIIFALIRSVRNMGWISILANLCIFVGCVSVLFYIFVGKGIYLSLYFHVPNRVCLSVLSHLNLP